MFLCLSLLDRWYLSIDAIVDEICETVIELLALCFAHHNFELSKQARGTKCTPTILFRREDTGHTARWLLQEFT
jgi:hypothetical protein